MNSIYQNSSILCFSDPPPLQNLCMVVVTVPPLPSSTKNGPVASNYQPQIIRCRELIFTEPDIIATPILHAERQVQIIMQQSLFKTGRLQARFKKMNFEVDKPRRVTANDYKSCFSYTLLAKIAPTWNKVGERLIRGRDFITNKGKQESITFELNVTGEEMYISLRAEMIKHSPVSLKDLEICGPVINEFLLNRPTGRIEEYSICKKWCHILPSMKKGQVINVLHKIPADSPFKCYKDVKRYWKNTHGYRLPDTDDGMLYYQVYFKLVGNILFTYPECCIQPREPVLFSHIDQAPIIHQFLEDLHSKLPKICGVPTVFLSDLKIPSRNLNNACEEQDSNLNLRGIPDRVVPRFSQLPAVEPRPWIPGAHHSQIERLRDTRGLDQTALSGTDEYAHRNFPTQGQSDDDMVGPSQPRIVPKFRPIFGNRLAGSGITRPPAGRTAEGMASTQKSQDFTKFVKHLSQRYSDPSDSASQTGATGVRTPEFASQTTRAPPPTHQALQASRQQTPTPRSAAANQERRNQGYQGVSALSQDMFRVDDTNDEAFIDNLSLFNGRSLDTTPIGSGTIRLPGHKRPGEVNAEGTPSKKPRTKTQIQTGVDIERLAANNQLTKVNGPTLIAWLKQRGVTCKSKDKKTELIDKVTALLEKRHLDAEA